MIKLNVKNLNNNSNNEFIEFNKEDDTIIMLIKKLDSNGEYVYITYSIPLEEFMPVVKLALDEPFLQKKMVGFGQLDLF